jgi:glycerol kinase
VNDPHTLKNLFFLPFFSGLGSPYWRPEARACLYGMTRDTGMAELAYACLEGIAFSVNDLLLSIQKDAGHKIKELKVDGGAVKNNLIMSLQANLSNSTIIRPKIIETTAYGAALGAAVGLGQIKINQVPKLWKKERIFIPQKKETLFYKEKNKEWDKHIKNLYLK